MSATDKSCWTCGWNRTDPPTQSEEVDLKNPPTLIGVCWGYLAERGMPMEIQATKSNGRYIADVGCKRWIAEKQDFEALRKTLEKAEPIEEEI